MIIKIAFVEDQNLFRQSLAGVIDGFGDCRVTIRARHGKELIEQMERIGPPDLVILDLNMPEMGGHETAQWLRSNHPDIPILVLTMYDFESMLIRLLQLGVRGFLKKDILPGELKEAIHSTIKAGYYYTGATTVKLIKLLQTGDADAPLGNTVSLTNAELQFLQLASTEMTYKEIATAMKISARTVDNYRDVLFVKLNVKSRIGLVLFAIQNGIVRLEY